MDKKHFQFVIGEVNDGTYVAISQVEPFFCLPAKTVSEAEKIALSAWKFFLRVTGKDGRDARITKKKSFKAKPISRHITKRSVISAVAC